MYLCVYMLTQSRVLINKVIIHRGFFVSLRQYTGCQDAGSCGLCTAVVIRQTRGVKHPTCSTFTTITGKYDLYAYIITHTVFI